jgi:hypothetical protein
MASAKRFTFISNIEHRADKNIKIPIEYDRKDQVFRCSFGGITYTEKTEEDLRSVMADVIRGTLDVPWIAVIIIQDGDHYGMGHTQEKTSIAFAVSRSWIALFPSGETKICKQWEGQEKGYLLYWCKPLEWDTENDGAFLLPCQQHRYAETYYYLPYTDDLWERVQTLQEMIAELKKHLISLFSTDQGIITLLASVPLQLGPAPVEIVAAAAKVLHE